ncbi:hypothetical protein BDQ17DRAFT_1424280 [Cyathus striatus]|nr:hypothetical protein BDQ17DRAFT_1424280 [Cyathus striatus]
MQRDGGSSSSSHPHNASVGQRGLPPRITVAPSVFPTGNPSVSPPQHPLAADTPSNNPQWIYTPPAVEGAQTSPPASMIASTSYYDGDQGSQHERTNAQQYQQWVYTSQQSQEQPYRREPQSVSQMQQHQFTFSQGVYSNTGSYNQYPSPGTHSNTGSMEYGNEGPSYQPQGNQVYGSYYPEMLPVTGDTTNSSPENSGPAYHTTTPESTLHSYSTTPDPAYPTQHQQQSQYLQNPPLQPVQLQQPRQHSSQPRSQHYPNSTYSRDIKPNQPQSNTQSLASSQSPTSWTENTRYSSVNTTTPQNQPSSSGTSVTKPSPPTTRPTNLKRQLGAADFTPTAGASSAGGKAAQKRKRRKNNEAQEWAFEEERDSDDSDYEDQPGISVGIGGLGVISEGSRGKGMRL